MGVWGYGRKKLSHTPNLPYSHTEWKPEPNVELHKLIHASVGFGSDGERDELGDGCVADVEVRTPRYGPIERGR